MTAKHLELRLPDLTTLCAHTTFIGSVGSGKACPPVDSLTRFLAEAENVPPPRGPEDTERPR